MLPAFLERDDDPIGLVKLGKDAIVSSNDRLQRVGRNRDFTVSIRRADKNNPVPYFTIWRFLCKVAVHANPLSCPWIPEQDEIGTNPENKYNALTWVIDKPIAALRPVTESVSNRAAVDLPTRVLA